MSAQTTGVLAVMDRMIRSVGARNDHTRDADLTAAHEACATVVELIYALRLCVVAIQDEDPEPLPDTYWHKPLTVARAALAKARGEA